MYSRTSSIGSQGDVSHGNLLNILEANNIEKNMKIEEVLSIDAASDDENLEAIIERRQKQLTTVIRKPEFDK